MNDNSFDYDEADLPKSGFWGDVLAIIFVLTFFPIYAIILYVFFGSEDNFFYNSRYHESLSAFMMRIIVLSIVLFYGILYFTRGCSTYLTRYHLNFKRILIFFFICTIFIFIESLLIVRSFYNGTSSSSVLYGIQAKLFTLIALRALYVSVICINKNKIVYYEIRKICLYNLFCYAYMFSIMIPFY